MATTNESEQRHGLVVFLIAAIVLAGLCSLIENGPRSSLAEARKWRILGRKMNGMPRTSSGLLSEDNIEISTPYSAPGLTKMDCLPTRITQVNPGLTLLLGPTSWYSSAPLFLYIYIGATRHRATGEPAVCGREGRSYSGCARGISETSPNQP